MSDLEVFIAALDVPEAEQEEFVRRACAGDEDLTHQILALLQAHTSLDDFLDRPSGGERLGGVTPNIGEKPGDEIGRYQLLEQIGEGGCGVVFVAEQREPVRRRVALKIVKPGMDTRSVIARFEAERQTLALMDHTSIAQIFDGGATGSGRPYFVMELVSGAKITEYCDEHSLTIEARLELFTQVCEAVQHAHQKGIIHRDIKPSNILVTTSSDGKPLPKVIDFGIAKATTNQRLTDKTLFTSFEMLIGTPAYMSPEQAALTSVDVDTRSDIYSLGVLLYELLAGETPFDTQELLKEGLDEVRRVIQTKAPMRPSARLSAMLPTEQTKISRERQSDPARLIRQLRGDLDCIVLKAMEKDRAMRYPTANAFATEVRRYLIGDVVSVRPPSTAYRLKKFLVRYKYAASGVAGLFLLLIGMLAFMSVLLIREKRLRENSEILASDSLTYVYVRDGKPELAESTFLQGMEIHRKRDPHYIPSAARVDNLMWALLYERKFEQAEAEMDDILAHGDSNSKEYEEILVLDVDVLARCGRWKKVQPIAQRILDEHPDDFGNYHRLAPLMVENNDLAGYKNLCRQILSRFSQTDNPVVADQMAKDCLILSSADVDLDTVAALAEVTITKGKLEPAYPYFLCCKALAEYRQGHFEEAAKWAGFATVNPFPYSQSESFVIQSMAQYKLNQTDDAQASLAKGEKVIQEQLPHRGNDLGQDWRDWIIVHALLDEAERLINPKK